MSKLNVSNFSGSFQQNSIEFEECFEIRDGVSIEYNLDHEERLENHKVCCIKVEYWNHAILLLNFIALILSIAALVNPKWVEQGDIYSYWSGGLFECGGCKGKFKELSYKDISYSACNSMEGYCRTFKALHEAGVVFIIIETGFFVLCSAWIVVNILALMNLHYDSKIVNAVVLSNPIAQFLALVAWVAISKAALSQDCNKKSTTMQESYKVCATQGPLFIFISMIITFFSSFLYFIIRRSVRKLSSAKVSQSSNMLNLS